VAAPARAVGAPPARAEGRWVFHLPYGWPLDGMFVAFGLWWVLGLHSFVWQIMAVPLAYRLISDRRALRVPRGFGIWLLFIIWNVLTIMALPRSSQLIGFGYRLSLYLSATVVFLFVYNAPRHLLPMRRIYGMAMAFWITVVVGGWLGVLVPNGAFPSFIELALPGPTHSNDFVRELVHPQFAQVQQFLGYPLGRPQAPFVYTNHWGSAFAITTPIVLLGWAHVDATRSRLALQLGLTAALIPAIVSLNRGMFLSLGAALIYASARSGRMGARARRALLATVVLLVVLVAVTPLGQLAEDRQASQHSNEGRSILYEQAISMTAKSPLLGYGAPQEVEGDLLLPPVGTQGQVWLVMVSHGFVGLALYIGFLVSLWRRTRHLASANAVAHLLILILLVQMFVYDLITAAHHVVFLVVAAALRDQHAADLEADLPPGQALEPVW
jgi:polysaccharide biosynthesis protein PslJ